MLFLLELEAFGRSLKLGFVHDEEVAGASLRKVWLGEDVLDAGDGADLALLVDVLELVHFVWLVDDPVAFLEVHQLVCLRSIEDVTELAIVVRAAALLALLGNSAGVRRLVVLLVAYQVLLVLGCCLGCLHWWVMLQLGAMLG